MSIQTTSKGKEILITPKLEIVFSALHRKTKDKYNKKDTEGDYRVVGLVDISTEEGQAFMKDLKSINANAGTVSEGKLKITAKSRFEVSVCDENGDEIDLETLPVVLKGATAKLALSVNRNKETGLGSTYLQDVKLFDIPEGTDYESSNSTSLIDEIRGLM